MTYCWSCGTSASPSLIMMGDIKKHFAENDRERLKQQNIAILASISMKLSDTNRLLQKIFDKLPDKPREEKDGNDKDDGEKQLSRSKVRWWKPHFMVQREERLRGKL